MAAAKHLKCLAYENLKTAVARAGYFRGDGGFDAYAETVGRFDPAGPGDREADAIAKLSFLWATKLQPLEDQFRRARNEKQREKLEDQRQAARRLRTAAMEFQMAFSGSGSSS